MILILKNLPTGVTGRELNALVSFVVDDAFDAASQPIRKTEIMVLFDREQGKFEFYGLVHCNGRQVGEAVSGLFNGFLMQGHALDVAEFFRRGSQQVVSVASNRRRILGEQVLLFNTIEEIEIPPVAEPEQTSGTQRLETQLSI